MGGPPLRGAAGGQLPGGATAGEVTAGEVTAGGAEPAGFERSACPARTGVAAPGRPSDGVDGRGAAPCDPACAGVLLRGTPSKYLESALLRDSVQGEFGASRGTARGSGLAGAGARCGRPAGGGRLENAAGSGGIKEDPGGGGVESNRSLSTSCATGAFNSRSRA